MARKRNAATEMRKAADRLGLAITTRRLGGRYISGRKRGTRITIESFQRQLEDGPIVTHTRFRVFWPRPLGLGLRLTRETFLTAIQKFFGAQDIKVGDRTFDDAVLVKGANPAKVIDFLSRPRRVRIHRFLMSHADAVISDKSVAWETAGRVQGAERIASTTLKMIDLARHLTEARPRDETMERSLHARKEGRLEESLALLGELRKQADPPAVEGDPVEIAEPRVEEQILEGELLSLANRQEDAKRIFDEALEQVPDDEEVQALAAAAAEPRSDRTEDTEARPARDVRDVCKALFNPEHSSFETNRVFDADFRGQVVFGCGPVLSASTYSVDLVFGQGPGTKAVVEVCEVETNFLGEQKVNAVVQLSSDVHDELRNATGDPVRFEGTLEKVDSFMRNVYVSHARLLDRAIGCVLSPDEN